VVSTTIFLQKQDSGFRHFSILESAFKLVYSSFVDFGNLQKVWIITLIHQSVIRVRNYDILT